MQPVGSPPAPSAPPGRETPSGARRPVNPFLANDPNAKARRLARALISDIITYFPDKHRQAVENGTLRETFEEEIKKSHQEYVDQVGKEFADATPHFTEALNEILARGQRIF